MRWGGIADATRQRVIAESGALEQRAPGVRLALVGSPPAIEEQPVPKLLGGDPPPAGFGLSAAESQAPSEVRQAATTSAQPPPAPLPAPSATLEGIRAWLAQRDAMAQALADERQTLVTRLAEVDHLLAELEAIGAKA